MRFTKTQQFLKSLKEFQHLGFGAYTTVKSAFNAAMSYNIQNAITGDYPDIRVDPTLFLVSRRSLPVPEWAEVTLQEVNRLLFSWDPTFPEGMYCNHDKVLLVMHHLQEYHASYRTSRARPCLHITTTQLPPIFLYLCEFCFPASLKIPNIQSILLSTGSFFISVISLLEVIFLNHAISLQVHNFCLL